MLILCLFYSVVLLLHYVQLCVLMCTAMRCSLTEQQSATRYLLFLMGVLVNWIRMQELNLVDSVPKQLDLENCVELRQISLGRGGGYSTTVEDKSNGAMERKLVLKGCNVLPDAVKKRVSETMYSAG